MDIWDKFWRANFNVPDIAYILSKDHYYFLLKRLLMDNHVFEYYSKPVKIAEVGCGSGIRSLALLMEYSTLIDEVIFFDKSQEALDIINLMAEKLPRELKAKIKLIRGDIFNMPIKKDSIDIVWNEGVMEHFSGKKRSYIFKCIYDIVKPKGFYLCIVPNRLNLPLIIRNFLLKKMDRWPYGFQKEFTIFELKSKMKDAGFKICSSAGVDSILPVKLLINEIANIFSQRIKNNNKNRNESKKAHFERLSYFHQLRACGWKIETKTIYGKLFGREIGVCGQKL